VIELAGSAALVTGGCGGIGRAVAQRLVAAGATVVLADIDDPEGIAERLGAHFVRTDVSRPADVAAAVAAAEEQAPLRFVHLNAGVTSTVPLEEVSEQLYSRAVGVNLDGVFWGIQSAAPALRRAGGGAIVATSSLAGLAPQSGDAIYSATKSAVIALVRSIGPTLRADGIRLNCVCPGFADTPMVPATVRESGFPMLTAGEVADAVLTIAHGDGDSDAYVLQPGLELMRYRFHGVPGARTQAGDGTSTVFSGEGIVGAG
jgi:NAD(P)-dependent dehydrogenase (short-subunit alcohol dehydrogenase family)